VRNEAVLQRFMEEKNIIQTMKRRKTNLIGRILCRNCFTKHVIEGKIDRRIEVKGIRGKRRKHLLNDLRKGEDTGN
jgi:hypothetical protein